MVGQVVSAPPMIGELVAIGCLVLMLIAEWVHARRSHRLASLAFGPTRKPRSWVRLSPALRILSVVALGWGLTTLIFVAPRSYRPESEVQPGKEQHLLLVLDVSPSMRLVDSGPTKKQSRKQRARDLMRSLVDRVPIDQYLMSVVAVYNGAKPVVVDSGDLDVIDGIMGDLPLFQAFEPGETRLLDGLKEAATIAKPWNPASTTVIVFSDGDTVPAQGMPTMPAAVGNVLVVGVGDPAQGSFINGRQSKQDVFTLRQIATRLRGKYHDGNQKNLPTALISEIVSRGMENKREPWSRREYALLAVGLGGFGFALLPWLLETFGTGYLPGVRAERRNSHPTLPFLTGGSGSQARGGFLRGSSNWRALSARKTRDSPEGE